jgi:hypothetical protein
MSVFGISTSLVGRYNQEVSAVTVADVLRVSSRLFNPEGARVVVVGDASKFADQLTEEGKPPLVVPVDSLTLDKAPWR